MLWIRGLFGHSGGFQSTMVDPDHVAVHPGKQDRILRRDCVQFKRRRIGRIVPDFVVPTHSADDPLAGSRLCNTLTNHFKDLLPGAIPDGQGQQAVTIHRKVHMAFDKSGVNKIPLQIMDLCLRATERKDLIVGAKRSDPSPGNGKSLR